MGVQWAHLFRLPISIIKKLNGIITHFIWSGMRQRQKFHLTKHEHISMPKQLGGWGIIHLKLFGHALLLKSLWCGIFGA